MIVYISGKYSGRTKEEVDANIRESEKVAKELWSAGIVALSPHLNTAHFEIEGVTYDDYIKGDLELLSRCDAILMLKDWMLSEGARKEKEFAKFLGMPIYYYPDTPIQREEMTTAQEYHLARIKNRFLRRVDKKYSAGQKEHGGDLFNKPNLPMLLEEADDLVVYSYTLEDQIQTANMLCADSESEKAGNILEYGNAEGKCYEGN